jgi:hypothetical protein
MLEGAITRDQSVIQPMLAPDFAWREDVPPLDEEPYDFWNRYKLWGDLQEALKDRPDAPGWSVDFPRSALRESYKGGRIAWRKVGAEWRLAYFLPWNDAGAVGLVPRSEPDPRRKKSWSSTKSWDYAFSLIEATASWMSRSKRSTSFSVVLHEHMKRAPPPMNW